MSGISSQVMIDQAGNRYGDYALLAMVENDEQQFKFKTVYQHLRSKGIQNYLSAKMPRINVPDQPIWTENSRLHQGPSKLVEKIDEKSYWILGGGIIFFVVALVIIFISSVLCCKRWNQKKMRKSSTTRTTLLEHRPLDQELSSYSMNSTNSLIRAPLPPIKTRHSTGGASCTVPSRKSRESKRLSGHCAVERTVTQLTYCSDTADRDSGLVESG